MIMLMGNMSSGLQECNGRKMIIRGMSDNNNNGYILTDTCKGHDVFIPCRDLGSK